MLRFRTLCSTLLALSTLTAALLVAGAAGAQSRFYLKNGDRIVFYGDSITEQRLYTSFVETYVVTRFPRLNVSFVHSGVGGDRVGGGWAGDINLRLDRDVIAYRPTVMTIMLGMNDASYRAFDTTIYNTYTTGYQHILDKVKAALPNVRFTLIEPSPFDDVTRAPNFADGYNAVLVRYSDFVKQLAQKEGQNVADLNTPVVAMLGNAKTTDATLATKIIPDRVHPGPGGHLIMAEALLKAWNAPATVTRVAIDAAAKKATQTDNTSLKNLAVSGDTLTWDQTDNALPFPLDMKDAPLALAVHSSDFVAALDQEPLKVTGLNAAKYALKIDGETVGSFTKEELAAGINLAEQSTPMTKQAALVHGLTWRHNDIHFTRWRQVQMPLASDKSSAVQKTLDAMDALDTALAKEQHEAAQPKAHHYELTPA